MTNPRPVPFLLFLLLTFTSLACPTRTIPFDGGTGGTAETDGSAGTTGAAGAIGGRGGADGGLAGAPGGLGGAGGKSAGGGGSGAHGGVGGSSSMGTGGTAGTGGTSSQAGAGGSGTGGIGGAGGTTTCTNTTTDALNCGGCGHSCLGGACAGGICQPLLLGTVPVTDFADETVVLGGKVYVFSDPSTTGNRTNVWQVDASTPSTPTEVTTNGRVSCIMDGQLFWTTYDSPYRAFSCTLSNCAPTATPIVTLSRWNEFRELAQVRSDK